MKKKHWLSFLTTFALCTSLHANQFQLVILGEEEPLLDEASLEEVDGIWIVNHEFPGHESKLIEQLQAIQKERPLNVRTIDHLIETISSYYDDQGHPLVLVTAPDQEVSQGVLQLKVTESRLGELVIQGNRWSRSKKLRHYMSLEPGDRIDEHDLFTSLYFINRNPFRQVDLIYSPGEEEHTTDITLAVRDRRPVRIYSGVDNTGVEPIHRNRWFAGLNWGNAFGLDQILSYQYTASFDVDTFQAHTGQYIIPFPWLHRLNIYGGYNSVEPSLTHPMLSNTGWGMQASLRYEIPFMIRRFLEQEWDVGFDFKRTNNTFAFADDTPAIGKNVNLSQLVLTYSGIYERNRYRLDFESDLFYSPCQWLPDQTPNDYATLRPGADPKWFYFQGMFNYLQKIGRFSFALTARGQGSTAALLPSEQFGLGGYETIRGYEERVVNKDNAIVLNAEMRSPSFALFSRSAKRKTDALQFLAFVDAGWGIDHTRNGNLPLSEYLIGVGPGVRYTWEPYLTGRFDLGFKLHKNDLIGTALTQIHFSVIMSY